MEVKIPKTLAEPWIIPWEKICTSDVLSILIIDALRKHIELMESASDVDENFFDVSGEIADMGASAVVDMLKDLAYEMGASKAVGFYRKLVNPKIKQVGYSYEINFRTPGTVNWSSAYIQHRWIKP